jgi:holo-[acyl-carrier protein] synthase
MQIQHSDSQYGLYGVGVDLISIRRVRRIYAQFPERFVRRILSIAEQQEFNTVSVKRKIYFIAKRFAAKEAVVKALGTGFRGGIRFSDIVIEHAHQGQPQVLLLGQARQVAQQVGVKHFFLSISDERRYCIAYVLAV